MTPPNPRIHALKARVDELLDELTAGRPDADTALTAVALASWLEDLERRAGAVTIHRDVLDRWTHALRTLLSVIATHHEDDHVAGKPELERDVVIDNGHDTPSVITRRVFYDVAEGVLLELEDYAG